MPERARPTVSRRDVMTYTASAAAVAVATDVASRPAQAGDRATYVLVHPAWHGAWCWKKVTPLLRTRGHGVWTPTLTGLGHRVHLARPDIGLHVHIEDVTAMLSFEDLTDVILVGHSSTGMVITAVADRMPERIRHVVYLDAFVPEDGQSLIDIMPPTLVPQVKARVEKEGGGWLLPRLYPPPWEEIVEKIWHISDEGDRRWMLQRLRPTPFKHFTESVERKNGAAEKLPRTYIRCRQFPNPIFDRYAQAAQQSSMWQYRELESSHEAFITAPEKLSDLLLEIAAR